ncbi:MAG TPA: M48 family metalloprotease [Gammaproteobacteria bacterium]|nr:M48 family metalloprotease [Gammaproteobacteria bacterium]
MLKTSTLLRASLLLASALLAACATNPVSGKEDLVLASQASEVAEGRQAHDEVIAHYGRYDNPALQDFIQQVGQQLAANSDRANLDYHFTVLDTPEVNAFALPGGYVYITRGMLAYLNSEAELAAVLGHEIGHVAARHSVRQQAAANVANLGYLLGSILLPELGTPGAQQLFNVVGGAVLSGYGREHELEADRLGAEYLARSGYDPQAIIEVLGVLKNQENFELQVAKQEGRPARTYHGLFASHPDNDTRLQQVVGQAESLKASANPRINHAGFVKMLDGVTFGDGEREGVRRGNNFYHKELGFALTFPEGWRVENQPDRIVAQPPGGDALLQINSEDVSEGLSPRDFMRNRLKLGNLQKGEAIQHRGMQGYTALAPARTSLGERLARITVLYFKDKAYIFGGVGADPDNPFTYDEDFINTARSFHALTAQERPLAEALHIKVIQAKAGTSIAALAGNSRIPDHAEEQLRLINHLYPDGEPGPGDLIKLVE